MSKISYKCQACNCLLLPWHCHFLEQVSGGGGGNNAVLVEPAGEAGCSPDNTRAVARVAEPDVTMRTKSMATTTFLIVGDMEMANIISLLLVVAHSSSLVSLLTY